MISLGLHYSGALKKYGMSFENAFPIGGRHCHVNAMPSSHIFSIFVMFVVKFYAPKNCTKMSNACKKKFPFIVFGVSTLLSKSNTFLIEFYCIHLPYL